mgnify:CR=1 FL=1
MDSVCREHGSTVTFEGAFTPTSVFCVRTKDVSGIAPRIAMYAMTQSLFSRLVTGRLLVNCFTLEKKDMTLELSAPDGARFVRWELSAGEEVFVRLRSLVAWTSGVRFRTTISFQLASIILGHMVYVSVQGPGAVVFEVRGKSDVRGPRHDETYSLDASRLVAWSSGLSFELVGSPKFFDVYLTQMHIRPTAEGCIVVGADERDKGGGGTIRRLFSRFYLPK